MKKPKIVLKEFRYKNLVVKERVSRQYARCPGNPENSPGTFTLRVDADSYNQDIFNDFSRVFEKYAIATTIFFSVKAFSQSADVIKRCYDAGIDIQSHGYYHYVYSDYKSNRHNIKKAKVFLETLDIRSNGFAAPFGKYNNNLMKAMVDEGYHYGSEFAYDYMSSPHMLELGKERSIMQIPIFPVAPELFFHRDTPDYMDVLSFYTKAIDKMVLMGLPVIIYCHTEYSIVSRLIDEVSEYALKTLGLRPLNMSEVYKEFKNTACKIDDATSFNRDDDPFFGTEITEKLSSRIVRYVRALFDLERITPEHELCGPILKRVVKILLRRSYGAIERIKLGRVKSD